MISNRRHRIFSYQFASAVLFLLAAAILVWVWFTPPQSVELLRSRKRTPMSETKLPQFGNLLTEKKLQGPLVDPPPKSEVVQKSTPIVQVRLPSGLRVDNIFMDAEKPAVVFWFKGQSAICRLGERFENVLVKKILERSVVVEYQSKVFQMELK